MDVYDDVEEESDEEDMMDLPTKPDLDSHRSIRVHRIFLGDTRWHTLDFEETEAIETPVLCPKIKFSIQCSSQGEGRRTF